jgi:PiT family inorganic phosphate transporter
LINLAISVLSFILAMLIAGNNLPISSGTIISSRVVRRNAGIAITVLGYIAGLLAQGGLLAHGFAYLMPSNSVNLIAIALAVSTILFVVGNQLRVPQSLSIILAMALIGTSIASGYRLNPGFLLFMLLFWIIAPIAAFLATMILLKRIDAYVKTKRVWSTLSMAKTLLILTSFFTAFTLGSNTIGLMFVAASGYTSIWVVIIAVVIGGFALSRGTLSRIGNEIVSLRYMNSLVSQSVSVILVEIATVFSLPFSNTQAFTASIYGAGMSYRTKLLSKRPLEVIVFTWIATAAASFALGYLFTVF